MRVTVICDVFGEANNGTVLAAKNLITYLVEKGHTVRIVSPDKSTEGEEGYYVVPPLHLGFVLDKVLEMNGVQLARADKSILREAIADSDVVHLLVPFPLSWAAISIARELGIPMTASFHCQAENFTAHVGLMHVKMANKLVYKFYDEKVYQYCTLIHYPTEFIRNDFESTVKKTTPGRVISNGVNDVFFEMAREPRAPRDPNRKFTIICVGRYSTEKAQQTLLRAVGLSRFKSSIRVILAGLGPKEQKLRKLAENRGLDCQFGFYEDREELAREIRNADLYVHTAVAELEAISCLEAIVLGSAALICNSERSATRFFAADERCLYERANPVDLRDKIDYFYMHPEEVERYRRIYSEKAAAYSQSDCMRQMEIMLEDAIRIQAERRNAEEAPAEN